MENVKTIKEVCDELLKNLEQQRGYLPNDEDEIDLQTTNKGDEDGK